MTSWFLLFGDLPYLIHFSVFRHLFFAQCFIFRLYLIENYKILLEKLRLKNFVVEIQIILIKITYSGKRF